MCIELLSLGWQKASTKFKNALKLEQIEQIQGKCLTVTLMCDMLGQLEKKKEKQLIPVI